MNKFRRWLAAKVAPGQTFLVKGQRYAGVPLTVPPGTKGVTIRNNTLTPPKP